MLFEKLISTFSKKFVEYKFRIILLTSLSVILSLILKFPYTFIVSLETLLLPSIMISFIISDFATEIIIK